ncbi:expressed unknown protein [Seminavis robusta]|uniref:Uncharacterized protein n=1 Tax=Seminavis robusta TaxID=568900 RepID=A0A9N8D8C9_9STRA|nr:expressed unknown protein [Seminavis robusta]|eukprot:Sro39_g023970.1 n/a (133) ;mRNA; r:22894-23292
MVDTTTFGHEQPSQQPPKSWHYHSMMMLGHTQLSGVSFCAYDHVDGQDFPTSSLAHDSVLVEGAGGDDKDDHMTERSGEDEERFSRLDSEVASFEDEDCSSQEAQKFWKLMFLFELDFGQCLLAGFKTICYN